MSKQQPLFEVIGFTFDRENNVITAHLDENKHYSEHVIIDGDKFEDYLNSYDQLYIETNAVIRGELVAVCDIISMEEFIEFSDYTHMCNQLYDYLTSIMQP